MNPEHDAAAAAAAAGSKRYGFLGHGLRILDITASSGSARTQGEQFHSASESTGIVT